MSNFITAFDLKVASFYKFPKELMGKDYNSMKLESKMAYTILLDRASLSIINGWVNDKGEIYVKIKRKVLMELLSIKGTQKITVVMDELASYGLIFEKKAGFGRCNEIYLGKLRDSNEDSNKNYDENSNNDLAKDLNGTLDERMNRNLNGILDGVLEKNLKLGKGKFYQGKEDESFFEEGSSDEMDKTFENQKSIKRKSKLFNFDFQKQNKTNINKTNSKKTKHNKSNSNILINNRSLVKGEVLIENRKGKVKMNSNLEKIDRMINGVSDNKTISNQSNNQVLIEIVNYRKVKNKTMDNQIEINIMERLEVNLAMEVLGWAVNENEAKELLLVAKGNVYILDLAHEILMKTNKKIHNFIAYMKALIKIISSENVINKNSARIENFIPEEGIING